MQLTIRGKLLSYCCLSGLIAASNAYAVGTGDDFGVAEGQVANSLLHQFQANSMDLTYHACDEVNTSAEENTDRLREQGYFWVSSFQDADSVLDSQINHFRPNGYRIYGIYTYQATLVAEGPTPLDGIRRGYQILDGSITLYLDPQQDTNIGLQNCSLVFQGITDDQRIGGATNVLLGEKSEKEGLANGDFEVVFDDWQWDVPTPIVPFSALSSMSFNANVTTLGGPIDGNHKTEGSGNLFWRE